MESLQFYPFRRFEVENRKFVFASESGGVFEIDDDSLALIEQENNVMKDVYKNLENRLEREKIDEIISQMKEFLFVKTDDNDMIVNKCASRDYGDGASAISLFVVQDCNMRCRYCYGDGGSYADKGVMTFDIAKKAVDFLFGQSGSNKNLSIVFFGGEPLLNFELIKKITVYSRGLEKEKDKKIYLSMTSNGTLFSEEIKLFCEENRISVQISLDGNKRIQDENRYFANYKGSYDKVIESTKDWRNEGRISCRATVTPCSLNITDSFYHLDKLGFHTIMFAPAENLLNDKEYEELTFRYLEFIDEFEKMIKEGDWERARKAKLIISALNRIEKCGPKTLVCGVGRNMYAIDINGDVYPCQRFVNTKEYCMGNIATQKIKRNEFLDSIHISEHKQCEKCWLKNLCVGNCPHDNLMSTQKVNKVADRLCKHQHAFYERLMEVYVKLTDEEKRVLFANK